MKAPLVFHNLQETQLRDSPERMAKGWQKGGTQKIADGLANRKQPCGNRKAEGQIFLKEKLFKDDNNRFL